MSMAKATVISAVITGVLLGGAQIIGYFINKKEEQPTTVWNNFNSGFQGVINNFSDTKKSETAETTAEAITITSPHAAVSKHLDSGEFPSGTLGYLTDETSLLDGATWQVDAAPGDRSLEITFQVTGQKAAEHSAGSITAKLIDSNNRTICTVTATPRTYSDPSDIFSNSCNIKGYVIPADSSIIFRSEAKAKNANIVDIRLIRVYAYNR